MHFATSSSSPIISEAFPIKDKCADTVADVLVDKIILLFGMPLVIHSDQGREFENGLMKSTWMCQNAYSTVPPRVGRHGGEV